MHTQAWQCSAWLLSLRTPTVVCSGNHDFWPKSRTGSVDPDAEGAWLRRLRGKGNIVAVDGDTVEFGGLRIAVNGWLQVPPLSSGHFDIVVSHSPPKGCPCASGVNGQDNGDPQIWDVLRWDPPSLLLAGHIHEPRKHWCRWPPTNPRTLVLVPGYEADATDAGPLGHRHRGAHGQAQQQQESSDLQMSGATALRLLRSSVSATHAIRNATGPGRLGHSSHLRLNRIAGQQGA